VEPYEVRSVANSDLCLLRDRSGPRLVADDGIGQR